MIKDLFYWSQVWDNEWMDQNANNMRDEYDDNEFGYERITEENSYLSNLCFPGYSINISSPNFKFTKLSKLDNTIFQNTKSIQ